MCKELKDFYRKLETIRDNKEERTKLTMINLGNTFKLLVN